LVGEGELIAQEAKEERWDMGGDLEVLSRAKVASCKQRYNYIKENEKKVQGEAWSKEHSLLLKRLREKGLSWEEITKSFPGREIRSCQTRYFKYLNKSEKKVQLKWSKEHSLLLKTLKEKGLSWKEILKSFPGRDIRSCQTRYSKHVNEGEKEVHVAFSKEHDILLKKLRENGLTWKKIVKSFPGRSVGSCRNRYYRIKGASHPSKGAARDSHRDSIDSSDDDEDNESSNNEINSDEVAASEPSPAAPLDEDVLPPVISSSSAALTYYPPPLPPRNQRRIFSSSGARRDEKLINEFVCHICTRLIFRAQVMRPCGCQVFCEECVPPHDDRTSACST
jgi:hypothetical protein